MGAAARVSFAVAIASACAAPEHAGFTCEVTVRQRYTPFEGDELLMFPDPVLALPDPSSPTGVRLSSDPSKAAWLGALPLQLGLLGEALDGLSGYGRMSPVILRFDGDLGEVGPDELRLLDLSTRPPTEVPFTVHPGEDGRQLRLQPLRPLRPGVAHAALLRASHTPVAGGCVGPAPVIRDLLEGRVDDPRLRPMAAQWLGLAAALGGEVDDVGAAVVWPVADERGALANVADEVRVRGAAWAARPTCQLRADRRECRGVMATRDYRQPDGRVGLPEVGVWEVPVLLYLPVATGPAPLLLYGHGLNSRASEAAAAADRMNPRGVAVVSAPALHHAEHPTAAGASDPLAFLGVQLEGLVVDPLAMRASFDQTTVDRLALLALLRAEPDVDGDGVVDLDTGRVAYLGVSLGGLLGPALLAHDGDVDAAALVVGGAHLERFVTDMELLRLAMPLLASLVGGEDALDRWLGVLQAAVDPSDPAGHAAHVLTDRRFGAAPHLLLEVATQDEVVPPATGQALARALALPHVAPVAEPVALVSPVLDAPVAGNLDGVTAGFLQLDRVTEGGAVVAALHHNTPFSAEGSAVWEAFLEGWVAGEAPRIVDPYAELGTPPLP